MRRELVLLSWELGAIPAYRRRRLCDDAVEISLASWYGPVDAGPAAWLSWSAQQTWWKRSRLQFLRDVLLVREREQVVLVHESDVLDSAARQLEGRPLGPKRALGTRWPLILGGLLLLRLRGQVILLKLL